jgi:hypothetical protein
MVDTRTMIGTAVAAVLVFAATPVAWAQQGFNGSVIGNVYQKPASGCGYGLGYLGPGCPYGGYVCSAPGSCYYRAGPSNTVSDRGNEAGTATRQRPLHPPQQ